MNLLAQTILIVFHATSKSFSGTPNSMRPSLIYLCIGSEPMNSSFITSSLHLTSNLFIFFTLLIVASLSNRLCRCSFIGSFKLSVYSSVLKGMHALLGRWTHSPNPYFNKSRLFDLAPMLTFVNSSSCMNDFFGSGGTFTFLPPSVYSWSSSWLDRDLVMGVSGLCS